MKRDNLTDRERFRMIQRELKKRMPEDITRYKDKAEEGQKTSKVALDTLELIFDINYEIIAEAMLAGEQVKTKMGIYKPKVVKSRSGHVWDAETQQMIWYDESDARLSVIFTPSVKFKNIKEKNNE